MASDQQHVTITMRPIGKAYLAAVIMIMRFTGWRPDVDKVVVRLVRWGFRVSPKA